MFLQITHIDESLVGRAQKHFDESYKESLTEKAFYEESLAARYLISEQIWNHYIPLADNDGVPKYQDANRWSLSHKRGLIFLWVHSDSIWVDIEKIKKRDASLLDIFSENEYAMLWGKTWKNFYIMWTSHEAIVKYKREKEYQEGMYRLVSSQSMRKDMSWMSFQMQLEFCTWEKKYNILIWQKQDYIYSVCI